ncbi:MAG: hypothetical protein QOF16_1522 [Actinomycetota bacterium]|nr:hypothetical protein [Actinomycetota bacterium]
MSVRRAKPGLVGAGALLLALAGTFLWLYMLAGPWRLASGLLDAKDALKHAQNAISNGSNKDARYETLAAQAAAHRAGEGLDSKSPLFALADLQSKLKGTLSQAGHLVDAARFSAAAAAGTLHIAESALRGPNRIIVPDPNDPKGSRFAIDKVEEVAGEIAHVHADVLNARDALAAVKLQSLPHRLRGDVTKAISKADKTDKLLNDAQAGFKILPGFLGQGGKRVYVLGMQNSAELRGSGGSLLQFSLLDIADGKPHLEKTKTVYNVDQNRQQISIPLPADAWYVSGIPDAQRFGNANWSPDWPFSAQLTLDYASATVGPSFPHIDGMIGVDPTVMQYLLNGAGRFHIKAGNYISPNKILQLLLYRLYASYPIAGQRRVVLHDIVNKFYDHMLHPAHATQLVKGMGNALAQKHMQVWFSDPAEESFVKRMKWDGALSTAQNSDYVDVVEQNVGGNKLDYFATQTNTMHVQIDGSDAQDSTTVQIHNGVWLPQPRYSMGDSGPWHRPMINVYVPDDAQLTTAHAPPTCVSLTPSYTTCRRDTPAPAAWTGGAVATHHELGKQVWSGTLEIAPGKDGSIGYDYRVPSVVRTIGNRSVYRLVVQHQAKLHPETMDITLELPAGATQIAAPGWKKTSATELEWRHVLTKDTTLEVSWRT